MKDNKHTNPEVLRFPVLPEVLNVAPYAPKSTTKWLTLQTAGHFFTKQRSRETNDSEMMTKMCLIWKINNKVIKLWDCNCKSVFSPLYFTPYVPLALQLLDSSLESNMVGRNREWLLVIMCRVDKGIRSFWTSPPPYISSNRLLRVFRKCWSL